ncbi:unnamed protein product [Pleuronectes platessa]|uniref:Uncharacterized protein n=1 Tax=Pleuronectes platessa TaxID=8262 RepID=A0A9N7VMB3_PLEPL|nr:unnamed protein product [Pleuronectes platessa]
MYGAWGAFVGLGGRRPRAPPLVTSPCHHQRDDAWQPLAMDELTAGGRKGALSSCCNFTQKYLHGTRDTVGVMSPHSLLPLLPPEAVAVSCESTSSSSSRMNQLHEEAQTSWFLQSPDK